MSSAHIFYAPARQPIFIELPAEDRLPGDEDKVAQLYSAIQTGGGLGMQTLDAALSRLVTDGVVTRQEAHAKSRAGLDQ